MIKIKLHSVTDLITNSSTVIFTYSDGTIQPLKEMINEILTTFGVDKTCDDLFDMVILKDDWYDYSDYYFENLNNEEGKFPEGVNSETDFEQFYNDVRTGKTPKPDWFEKVEAEESRCDYYRDSNYLYLIPKDEKYAKMARLIHSFLYSTDHEATRDG